MGMFERYLTLWVALCIPVGLVLGSHFPAMFQNIERIEIARINLIVAILIWFMIIPMMLKIDLGSIKNIRKFSAGILVTLLVNWGIKPFSMALLASILIGSLFRGWLPAEQIESYIGGLILLAAAPCTAMVFVWSYLVRGEPYFTLSQVALNDIIMVVAFAPIVGLLLGLSSIAVPWNTLLLSVLLYVVVPLVIASGWRRYLLASDKGESRLANLIRLIHPYSVLALLLMLLLLFAFQGEQIIRQPVIVLLLSVPVLIQVFLNFGVAYLLNRVVRVPHCIAGPSALIGASNFFELAVATAIALFGLDSGAALATVTGVLIEVPAMLLAVAVINRSRGWYERRQGLISNEKCCPEKIMSEVRTGMG